MELPMICNNCDSTLKEIIRIYKKNKHDEKKLKECTINALDYDKKKKTCLEFFFESTYSNFIKGLI